MGFTFENLYRETEITLLGKVPS